MIRYTTPTVELVIEGVDLTGLTVLATLGQKRQRLTIESEQVTYDGTDTTVIVTLTQEQLGRFAEGDAEMQVNWIWPSGKRGATLKAPVSIYGNLLERVVAYGG